MWVAGSHRAAPLADYVYAYRRFLAAPQARFALFRQARSPVYETLLVQTWTLNRRGSASGDSASFALRTADAWPKRRSV
jgi:hypothetical protein